MRHVYLVTACFIAMGSVSFSVDIELARICAANTLGFWHEVMDEFKRVADFAEVFAHGIGILLIAVTIYVLDPNRRWILPRVLTCAFGAGLLCTFMKLLLARQRPYDVVDLSTTTAWATFGPWLPAINAENYGSNLQSFPSGHTSAAVGFAVGLGWAYPRGQWLFATFAALAACQRILSGNHFLSDTCFAAALAFLFASLCTGSGRIADWFDRREAKWQVSKE